MRGALLVLLISAATAAAGQNLVTNGTFDRDLSSWIDNGNAAMWNADDANGNPTSGSAQITGRGILVHCGIRITGGRTYTFSARVKQTNTTSGPAMFALQWQGASDCGASPIENAYASTTTTTGTWVTVSGTATAPANAQYVIIFLTANWSVPADMTPSNTARFDDIIVKEHSCVLKCSATAPLTGSTTSLVRFTANGTTTSACPQVTYTWRFGDQTAPTSVQNPVHLYDRAGSYDWSVTMTAGSTSCEKHGTITIAPPTVTTPPLLFLYGYCGGTTTWERMVVNLQTISSTRYTGPLVNLYFDGVQVRTYPGNSTVIPAARLYGMVYVDPATKSADRFAVYQIPIEDLGRQVQPVITAIRAATGAPRVDLVAHSMGGLVARTYLEGFVQPYDGSIRTLITLDTPHKGASGPAFNPLGICFLDSPTVQRTQMDPASEFIARLNQTPLPGNVRVLAIATTGATCGISCLPLPSGDGIVSYASQDLTCQAARDVGSTSCSSIYDCQPNIQLFRNISPTPDSHISVHDSRPIAMLIDQQLRSNTTALVCATVAAGASASIAAPTTTAATVAVTATFDGPQTLATSAVCAAAIRIVKDGVTIADKSVEASATQHVSFGLIDAGEWSVEITPACDVLLTASVDTTPANSRRRSVRH